MERSMSCSWFDDCISTSIVYKNEYRQSLILLSNSSPHSAVKPLRHSNIHEARAYSHPFSYMFPIYYRQYFRTCPARIFRVLKFTFRTFSHNVKPPPSQRSCQQTVVYLYIFRERKEFFLRVLSLKMYISYLIIVKGICPNYNFFLKFLKWK